MADEKTKNAAKGIGTTAAGAIGTAYGGPAGGAIASQGAASLCDCCCGNASKSAEQKKAIEQQHPLTGDPAVDAQIQKQRDEEFRKWQNMQDVQQFEQLPADTKALLPGMKQFADKIYNELPAEDRNLTLAEVVKKHPALAASVYAEIQRVVPSLAAVPLDYAMALAKASGADQIKVSEIKERLDYVAENAPSAKAMMGVSTATLAIGGVGAIAALVGIVWAVKKFRG